MCSANCQLSSGGFRRFSGRFSRFFPLIFPSASLNKTPIRKILWTLESVRTIRANRILLSKILNLTNFKLAILIFIDLERTHYSIRKLDISHGDYIKAIRNFRRKSPLSPNFRLTMFPIQKLLTTRYLRFDTFRHPELRSILYVSLNPSASKLILPTVLRSET